MSSTSYYHELLDFSAARSKELKSLKVLSKGKDAKFIRTEHSNVAHMINPDYGYALRTMLQFVEELRAGEHSGKHRHNNEAIIHVLRGRGYSIIEDNRYDWEEGDSLTVPPMSWHQHFNPTNEPARLLGTTNVPFMKMLGAFHIDHAEDSQ